jgi:HK97 family phage major capsid protein
MKTVKELLEERGDLLKKADTIVENAQKEKRSITSSEKNEFDTSMDKIDAIDVKLKEIKSQRQRRNVIQLTNNRNDVMTERNGNERGKSNLGLTMRQMVGLDLDIENRAIVSSGSALIQNPIVVDDIVYALQSSNPLIDAGVQFVNIENNRQVPSVTGYPAATWVNESSTLSATDPAIDSIKWSLKDIAILVKVKNNVLYDAATDVEKMVNAVTEKSINDAILKAMFYGLAANNQPNGIDTFAGALEVDMGTDGATLNSYYPLVTATRKLMEANINKKDVSFIYNPFVSEKIARLCDSTGQPLNQPAMIEGLRNFETTAVKSDYTQGATSDTTRIYAGDFSKMIIGLGGSFSITLDQRYAEELTTGFIVHTRIDMKPLYESAFCIIKGITTT